MKPHLFSQTYPLELIDTGQPFQPMSFFNYSSLFSINSLDDLLNPPIRVKVPNYDLWTCCIDEPNRCYYSLVFYPKIHTKGKSIEVIYWDPFTGFQIVPWVHGKIGLYSSIVENVMLVNHYVHDDFWGMEDGKIESWDEIRDEVIKTEERFLKNRKTITTSIIKKMQDYYPIVRYT